jgi:hypothetical protein
LLYKTWIRNSVGCCKTILNGILFEKINKKLIDNNLIKIILNMDIILKKIYIIRNFYIDIYKNPDEAFVIIKNEEYIIKILKKIKLLMAQVEDELKTGKFNRTEYEKIFNILLILYKQNYKLKLIHFFIMF